MMWIRCFFILLTISLPAFGGGDKKSSTSNELQIVFCVDLSGSTNGLINDLRDNLWHIINQANMLTPQPELKIGVVAFSRPSFKKENSYVKVLCDLTTDFDYLAAELSRLRPSIEMGDQYVGAALKKCVVDISWSAAARKIIYIVGNGNVVDVTNEYLHSCELAVKRNIIVNAIYVVGKNKAKELPGWHRIAAAGNGLTSEITLGARDDASITTVNYTELFNAARDYNLTCMYYSMNSYEKYMNYRKADSLAFTGGNLTFYERLYYKNKHFANGSNASWDFVDYFTKTGYMPAFTDSSLFPDSLKNKTQEYIFDLARTLKAERSRAMASLVNLLSTDIPLDLHHRYLNGDLMEDRNFFSRCVVNMLIKEYP
jgi:hypothetical protein